MEPRCVLFVCFLFFSFGRARSYGLPRWLSRKESACNAGDAGDLGSEYPLEEEMATCSSILIWKIPGTEEPGELQCMGSHRDGHD